MGEIAIFTEAIANELIQRGFHLVRIGGRGTVIHFFEDSVLLRAAVDELLESYTADGR